MEINESLDSIGSLCLNVIETPNYDILNHFFFILDKIPQILANSPETFYNKLLKMKEMHMFVAL